MEDKQTVRDPEYTLNRTDLRDLKAKRIIAEKRQMLALRVVVVFPKVSVMKELQFKRIIKKITDWTIIC